MPNRELQNKFCTVKSFAIFKVCPESPQKGNHTDKKVVFLGTKTSVRSKRHPTNTERNYT